MQSSRSRSTDAIVVVAVTLLALAAAWYFRTVLVTSDPWHYAKSALYFGQHEWIPAGLTRWGVIVPLIPVAALFGDTLPTYYAFAAMAVVVVVPVVYLLTRRVLAVGVSVVAVVVFLLQPLTFVNLSRGYPDLMAVALNGLTLLLVLTARQVRRPLPWLFAAGLIAGWAFEVRETTMFTWPIFAWLIWRMPSRWAGFGTVVLGLLPAAVVDVMLSSLTLGDPLAKYRVIAGSDLNDSTSVLDADYLGRSRWWYLARLPVAMAEQPWGWVLLLVAGLGLVGGVVLWRDVGIYAVWAVLPAVLLALQAGVLDPQRPSVRVDVPRYWLAFTPGLTICAVALCAWLATRVRLPALLGPVALSLVLVVPWVRYVTTDPTFRTTGGSSIEAAVDRIPPGSTVWVDGRTYRILPVYAAGRDLDVRDFTRKNRPARGDLVLMFSDTDQTCPFCKLDYDLWRDGGNSLPLDRYDLLWAAPTGNARLYRVE